MAFDGNDFFKNTITELYQQTSISNSLDTRGNRQLFLRGVRNFEANMVDNWQTILYPILNGPKDSTYQPYSGVRSATWAEYDILDPEYGGLHGWTLTTEPWATSNSMSALWDSEYERPRSVAGSIYYLVQQIESVRNITTPEVPDAYDDTGVTTDIADLRQDLLTSYKDVYGATHPFTGDGVKKQDHSVYSHIKEILSLFNGGPTITVDVTGEPSYPNMSLNVAVSGLSYDAGIGQDKITDLVSDLANIRTFLGMNTNVAVPDYGSPTHVTNGESLESAIIDLDTVVGSLSGSQVSEFNDLTDVNIPGPQDGDIPKYNDTSQKWETTQISIPVSIDDLNDVNVPDPQDGQIMKYDGTAEEWVSVDLPILPELVVKTDGNTFTLPDASTNENKQYIIKSNYDGSFTVATTGADTIDEEDSVIVTQKGTSLTFISDGTEWWII